MSGPSDDDIKQLEAELRVPLSQWMTRPVTSGDTAALIGALQPEFDRLREAAEDERFARRRVTPVRRPSLLRLLRSQLSAYSRVYWAASLVVFGMLMLLLSTLDEVPSHSVGFVFTLALPVLLLASLAYSFRSWNREMRMIESITPYPPSLLLVVRTMIVIGLNLVLGLAGSLYMNAHMQAFPLFPFLLQWLSLLLLLSGVAAYVLMWKGFRAAFVCSILLWMCWNGAEQRVVQLVGQTAAQHLTLLYAAALAAGLLLLALAYRRGFGAKLLP